MLGSRVIVTPETFLADVRRLEASRVFAIDTETTGLRPYHGDRLFSIVIASEDASFYFNFLDYGDGSPVLGWQHKAPLRDFMRSDPDRLWFIHNASFDLAILEASGFELVGTVHCTKSLARVEYNEHHTYNLADCAERIGLAKDDRVEKYIFEHGLWDWVSIPGKDRRDKKLYFDRVPFPLISEYGLIDAEVTLRLGNSQIQRLEVMDQGLGPTSPKVARIVANERLLTRTVHSLTQTGVLIDREFCSRAIEHERKQADMARATFLALTGKEFKNSGKVFAEVFAGEKFVLTGKGNPSFDSDVLATFSHPAAKAVLAFRDAKSKGDFYQGFLYHADAEGVLRGGLNQGGTTTGRFSSSSPNLQNLTKDEGEGLQAEFVIRRAIVPRPGYFFAMLDMDQAEYRLMLDYCNARGLIRKILVEGLDVHQATADLAGITRSQAKNTNFATLYGAGIVKLAGMLKTTRVQAEAIRGAIFRAAPEIEEFIRTVQDRAKNRGYLFNWAGRRYMFPDPNKAFKGPNYLCQGGIADCVKIAMNDVHGYLRGRRSRLVLNIHDEIVLEMHESEGHLLSEIKGIAEAVYPHRHIPLTWGVDHSFKSLADKVPWCPPQAGLPLLSKA